MTKALSSGTTSYAWDFENRLTSVTLPGSGGTVNFKYDPFGRRIQKAFTQGSTTTTTNYLYDGADTVEERDQNGNVLAQYSRTMNIDEPLAESRSGTTSFYEQDGLGSVTTLTNSSGSVAESYTYDSFGILTASTGSTTNPFRYTGREFDTETSLYYYRARYYDSNSGRFGSEDRARFRVGPNFYNYVHNRPVDLVDPSGNDPGVLPWPWPWTLPWPGLGRAIAVGSRVLGAAAIVAHYPLFAPSTCPEHDKGRECEKEWEEAYATCRELLSQPHPPRGLTGGYNDLEKCARGFVSEECGGNPMDWGKSKK